MKSSENLHFLEFPTAEDADTLLEWHSQWGKTYPWNPPHELPPDPYAVWISEVMLQQTTVSAVTPRYIRWMQRFPTVEALASANLEEVLREWEGLGYYSRVRNLHRAACEILNHGGHLPKTRYALKKLPGIGPYIASAISSIAFNQPVAAVEANGRRIVRRITGCSDWNRHRESAFEKNIQDSMPPENPGKLNIALMHFGQNICLPRNPHCSQCPFSTQCQGFQLGTQENLSATKRPKTIKKSTQIAVLRKNNQTWIRKKNAGITAGLWGFPETSELIAPESWEFAACMEPHTHLYTKYRDELHPIIYTPMVPDILDDPTLNGSWVSIHAMDNYGMSSAHRRIAENLALIACMDEPDY